MVGHRSNTGAPHNRNDMLSWTRDVCGSYVSGCIVRFSIGCPGSECALHDAVGHRPCSPMLWYLLMVELFIVFTRITRVVIPLGKLVYSRKATPRRHRLLPLLSHSQTSRPRSPRLAINLLPTLSKPSTKSQSRSRALATQDTARRRVSAVANLARAKS